MTHKVSVYSGKSEVTETMTTEKELELIGNYSRTALTEEDVYIFTLTLCDNEIDRDFERFSKDALASLEELFVGKTGISDHSMSSKDQRARIFRTYIETDKSRKTSSGEVYTALKARAYMLRTEENASLIKEIDGGIKKEVSVGCAMKECICSICGSDMKKHRCEHIKGRTYGGKLCHGILKNPTDAYEWSFVAVPAQRLAGVTKAFNIKEENDSPMTIETVKSLKEDTVLTAKQLEELCGEIAHLEQLASEALLYKEHLTEDIRKFALILMPKVNAASFVKGCSAMNTSELKSFRDSLEKQAIKIVPVKNQLSPVNQHAHYSDNTVFKI